MWKNLFEGIQFIFEELLFIPFELFRETQLWNWWIANGINFIFAIIGFIAINMKHNSNLTKKLTMKMVFNVDGIHF